MLREWEQRGKGSMLLIRPQIQLLDLRLRERCEAASTWLHS